MLDHSTGMKSIRVRTGEVVAVYARVGMSAEETGKISEKNDMDLGFEFQLMAVICVLLILKTERREAI